MVTFNLMGNKNSEKMISSLQRDLIYSTHAVPSHEGQPLVVPVPLKNEFCHLK